MEIPFQPHFQESGVNPTMSQLRLQTKSGEKRKEPLEGKSWSRIKRLLTGIYAPQSLVVLNLMSRFWRPLLGLNRLYRGFRSEAPTGGRKSPLRLSWFWAI